MWSWRQGVMCHAGGTVDHVMHGGRVARLQVHVVVVVLGVGGARW